MTVSVVIPVYNAASFLDRCVQSLLTQSHRDLDVILIDDGSTDGSSAHCDSCAARDDRVRVIHQANAGVSAARNVGLDASKGSHILFVDSDDYLEPTAVEELLKAMNSYGVQLAVCSHYATRIGRDNNVLASTPIRIANCGVKPREQWFQVRYDDAAPCGKDEISRVWGKLFLAEAIRSNRIRFREELRWLEDITFCLEYATTIQQAVSLPDVLCHHCYFEEGVHTTLTRKVFPDEFDNINYAYAALLEVYAAHDVGPDARQCLDGFYARNVIGCFIRIFSNQSPFTREQALTRAREICEAPLVRKTLATYHAAAGSSRLIPFLMRRGMVRAAAQVAILRK